jgi:hypothetical protein
VTGSTNGDKRSTENTGIRRDFLQKLEAMMGKAYASIVVQFMSAANFANSMETSTEPQVPQHKNLLHLEIDCLEKLRSIAEVL